MKAFQILFFVCLCILLLPSLSQSEALCVEPKIVQPLSQNITEATELQSLIHSVLSRQPDPPTFSPDFQVYAPNPELRHRLGLQLRQGFKDALIMAAVTALTFNPCEEVFLRYFGPGDADFVRREDFFDGLKLPVVILTDGPCRSLRCHVKLPP